MSSTQEKPVKNTDVELWREPTNEPGMSYYMPSVHVTQAGKIGINVGGSVYVKSLTEWHELAGGSLVQSPNPSDQSTQEKLEEIRSRYFQAELIREEKPQSQKITCPNCDHQFAWGDAQVSEEQRAIYELYQHGHSIRAIGRMFKMHPESVRYRIKELNRNKYVEPNPVQEKQE